MSKTITYATSLGVWLIAGVVAAEVFELKAEAYRVCTNGLISCKNDEEWVKTLQSDRYSEIAEKKYKLVGKVTSGKDFALKDVVPLKFPLRYSMSQATSTGTSNGLPSDYFETAEGIFLTGKIDYDRTSKTIDLQFDVRTTEVKRWSYYYMLPLKKSSPSRKDPVAITPDLIEHRYATGISIRSGETG